MEFFEQIIKILGIIFGIGLWVLIAEPFISALFDDKEKDKEDVDNSDDNIDV